MPLRALVVDDEQPARQELCFQLDRIGAVEVAGRPATHRGLALIDALHPTSCARYQMPGATASTWPANAGAFRSTPASCS